MGLPEWEDVAVESQLTCRTKTARKKCTMCGLRNVEKERETQRIHKNRHMVTPHSRINGVK